MVIHLTLPFKVTIASLYTFETIRFSRATFDSEKTWNIQAAFLPSFLTNTHTEQVYKPLQMKGWMWNDSICFFMQSHIEHFVLLSIEIQLIFCTSSYSVCILLSQLIVLYNYTQLQLQTNIRLHSVQLQTNICLHSVQQQTNIRVHSVQQMITITIVHITTLACIFISAYNTNMILCCVQHGLFIYTNATSWLYHRWSTKTLMCYLGV